MALSRATNPFLSTSGAGNVSITSPAANTIAFTTGGTEDMRIDSAGNIGIGTASPAYKLDVVGTINVPADSSYTLGAGADRYIKYRSGNGDILYSFSAGNFYQQSITSSYHAWFTGNNERMRIDSNGLVTVASGQIKFPASQNASADANTLDDYEEGTWTPTLTFAGGTTGITYSQQLGTYVKFGRLVWLNCRVALTAKGSSTGSARITGIPFGGAGGSGGSEIQVGALWYNAFTNASNYHINVRQDSGSNSTYMELRAYAGGSETEVNQGWFNNNSQFSFTILYWTTG